MRRDIDGQGSIAAPTTVRIERLLPGPVDRIWHCLTDSEKRRQWLAAGEMEPHVGGRVEHLFRHKELSQEETPARFRAMEDSPVLVGTVTQWDPPRILAYTWPGDGGASEVTFELFPEGADVLLVLTHRRLADAETMVSVASGWDAHVGILIDYLEGVPARGFWTAHAGLEEIYRERFSLTTEEGVSPNHVVSVERDFEVSADALYSAWTEPSIMRQWFGRVEADVRIGGSYQVESDGDAGEVYTHGGRYLALEPGHFLKQTFSVLADEPSAYTDEFIAIFFSALSAEQTRLVLHNGWNGPALSAEDVEKAKQGWSMWLDLLEGLYTRQPEVRRRQ